MRAISLWQFWASAVILKLKKFETRHWPTPYRGTLLIHAAKRPCKTEWLRLHDGFEDTARRDMILPAFHSVGVTTYNQLPLGALLGTVRLVGCYSTGQYARMVPPMELAFGDWSPGRFCWLFEDVRLFEQPVPYKGHQGFFNVPLFDFPGGVLPAYKEV